MPAPTATTLKTRLYAKSLAECPGWQEWALPLLRKLIAQKRRNLCEDTDFPEDLLPAEKHALRALSHDFLGLLHTQTRGAFDTALPLIHTQEIDSTLPDPVTIEKTLAAFSEDPTGQSRQIVPEPAPPSTPPAPTDFNPFAGQPQPLPRQP